MLPGKGCSAFLIFYRNPVSSACVALTLIHTGMQSHALHILAHRVFSVQAHPSGRQRITYLPSSSHRIMLSGPTGAFQGQSSPAHHRHLDSSVVWCQIYWDAPESSLWGSARTVQGPLSATVHQNAKPFAVIPRLLNATSQVPAANTSIAEIKTRAWCPLGTIWLLSCKKPLSICQPLTFLLRISLGCSSGWLQAADRSWVITDWGLEEEKEFMFLKGAWPTRW